MVRLDWYCCLILSVLLGWGVRPSYQQQCPGTAYYRSEKNGQTRLTYLEDGNYTIQGLLMFSESRPLCSQISRSGLTQMFAIKYAIDRFNKDAFYGRRATIGLQLDDDCGQLPSTMARGIEVVSFHRPNSVCRSDFIRCHTTDNSLKNVVIKEASAVIGTAMSFTTIPLSSLMSLYDIPQVSPSASSRLLSKKDLYKSFFRTIPSDTNQIKTMLDIFKRFNWNYIFAIGSDDDYGKLGVSDLKQYTSSRTGKDKICIYKDEYIPYQSEKTKSKIEEVVKKIKEGERAKVVVLFLYVQEIGERIIREAQRQGVNRIWLTSEAWNPAAAQIFSEKDNLKYKNQTHGILSVSLQKYALPGLKSYIKEQIRQNYGCNKWLQSYVERKHKCKMTNLNGDQFICYQNASHRLNVSDILADLTEFPGTTDRLIDAAHALGLSIQKVLNDSCPDNTVPCHIDKLQPGNITNAMNNISFVNEQGQTISFDKGEPSTAFYTIENLVYEDGKMVYKPVGSWSNDKLVLDTNAIQWPYWFEQNTTTKDSPFSRCSPTCLPGEYVVGLHGCCWSCLKCESLYNYTDVEMLDRCKECPKYHHTLDNKKCIPTKIKWLEISDPAGSSIVIISAIGFLISVATTTFISKYNVLVKQHDTSPHMLTFVCVLLFLTFIYGPFHVLEPQDSLCKFRNGYFFILLMMYCAFVLVKTQAMTSYLRGHADRTFGGRLLVTQLLVLLLFFLLELVSVIAWLYVDGRQLDEDRQDNNGEHVIWKQCVVEFTAARLVSTFIPCIILIIATFCAFRERNADHSFYEPKFLSFSCIALCIIIVAFLPTFRYVVGIYKAIVLAYTMNVFGFTFLACLILPKVYVGVMRKRRGIEEYPMKPGATKKKKKKSDKKRAKNNDNDSTVMESTKTKSTVDDDVVDDVADDVTEVKLEEKKPNGLENGNGSEFNGYTGENHC